LTVHLRHWLSGFFFAALLGLVWLSQPLWQLSSVAQSANNTSEAQWQNWSEQKVQTALQQGQPVFVDFTAAWCVTCQVNKQSTLRNAQVLKAFADRNVLLLQADWTRQDPAISKALNALGRSGVPVYVWGIHWSASGLFASDMLNGLLRAGPVAR
jgi:thiol:disulfide interchange protein DsbD